MKLTLGTLVTPNIKLIRELSRGAMGTVWVAHHRELGRSVAIKFISDPRSRDVEAVKRFRRETDAVTQIRSPHVARVLEHGATADGMPYIVMELLEGETLEARLTRQGMLTREDAGVVLRQAGSALDAAHARGIIHRDIKPSNIFIIGHDRRRIALLKVLDFGLAKAWRRPEDETFTQQGVALGTTEYMSPEQLLGAKDVDFRTDLWALAVVTYRMLTGELPFKAPTRHALFYAICKGTYTPLASTPAPIELEPWFKRAFEPSKDKRFGSAREMMLRFEQTAATIEDDDDVDEYESTQLLNAGKLLETAKAAWAMRPPSAPPIDEDDDLAATAFVGDSSATHDMTDDDQLPTREMAPHEAQQAVRAFLAQQAAQQQAQQPVPVVHQQPVAPHAYPPPAQPAQAQPAQAQPAQAQPAQAQPPPQPSPSHPGHPMQAPMPQPYAQPSSPAYAGGSAPSYSDQPPVSSPRPESLPQPPMAGPAPFGAARLEAVGRPQPSFGTPEVSPAPHRASDSPWSGPESPMYREAPKRRRAGLGFIVALLLVIGAVAAYLAIKRPEWLGLGSTVEAETPAEPTPQPAAPSTSAQEPAASATASAAPSASAAAVPTDQGLLTVMCHPDCEITIDGKAAGTAPVFEKPLAVGIHEVKATRNGYRAKSVRVELRSGERETIKIAMDQREGPARPAEPAPSPAPTAEP